VGRVNLVLPGLLALSLAPIAPVEYCHAACSLASNHDLGMAIAELDLTDWPASGVKLAQNYRRAIPGASRRPAGTQITASRDLDGCRGRIEVRLEHRAGKSRGCPEGRI
jgi:hypothetical protein